MTSVLFFTLLATLAVSFVLASDLNLGGPVENDHSVRNATVIRKPRRHHPQRVVIGLGDGSNITSIRAVDHNVTNNASVSVIHGGIGHRGVLLHLQAPRNRGLNFTIEVRGVRPPKPSPPPPPPTRPPRPTPPTRPPPPPPTTRPPTPPANSTESAPPANSTESVPPSESTVPPQEEEEGEEQAEEVAEEAS